jgi:hypothetical protein
MAVTTKRVPYAYTRLEDRAGEAARVLGALREGGVNLLAFTGFGAGGGKAKLTVVPASAETLQAAAKKAGIALSPIKECFLVQGDDRPGAAFEVLQKLAQAKVNVTASSAAAEGHGRFGLFLFVKQADVAAAAKALGA